MYALLLALILSLVSLVITKVKVNKEMNKQIQEEERKENADRVVQRLLFLKEQDMEGFISKETSFDLEEYQSRKDAPVDIDLSRITYLEAHKLRRQSVKPKDTGLKEWLGYVKEYDTFRNNYYTKDKSS